MNLSAKTKRLMILALFALGVGGCATTGGQVCVQPPVVGEELRLDAPGNRSRIDDHVYFSKEASSGGRSFGGGGCGCN